MFIDDSHQTPPVVIPDLSPPKVLVGTCGGVVVLCESELPAFYEGYRSFMIVVFIATILAVAILFFTHW